MADIQRLTEAVNKSGFPLQIGVASLIKTTAEKHSWNVLHSEYAWSHGEEEGFIDLVLERKKRDLVLVVECKRVQEADWIFLVPDDELQLRRHTKSWVTYHEKNELDKYELRKFGWHDNAGEPRSLESSYFVVHGQDPKSYPMLERIGGALVASTEAFAREEEKLGIKDHSNLRVYFNVVVTTANLNVCSFDPTQISLADGTILNPKFQNVPYIRFRKQLSTRSLLSDIEVPPLREVAYAKENTIFVVNSTNVEKFLKEMDIDN